MPYEYLLLYIGLIVCCKMRYCQEIEDLLRISQVYDNNTKTIHDVLLNLNWEGNWKSNDLASLGHKLTRMAALCRLRNETIKFVLNISQVGKVDSKVCKESSVIPDNTFLVNFQEKLLNQLTESQIQVDIYSVKLKQLREEVKATLIACGHCDLTDLLPDLEVGNQDQIVRLQIMLQWVYPNGKSCCNKNFVGSASSQKIIEVQDTPSKSSNTSCDSTVLDTGISKSDSTKIDLEVQDTPSKSPNTSCDSTVLDPGIPKSDSTKMDLEVQDTPSKSPKTSCDSTVLDTGIPKSDSTKMDLEVQDTPSKSPNTSCDSTVLDTGIP